MTTLRMRPSKLQAPLVPLEKAEFERLRNEFDRADLTAREFFFRKAIGAYLDGQLPLLNLGYSMQGVLPAMSKAEIEDFLQLLETETVGLNGARDIYMTNLWANFKVTGKTNRPF